MKLEDIPKKHNFKVPEGYFDSLPGRVQSRIMRQTKPQQSFFIRYKLQFVLPILLAALALFWFLPSNSREDAESILASVETADMIAYLNASELTTEEVMDELHFNSSDVEEIEMEIYQLQLDDAIFDALIEENETENM